MTGPFVAVEMVLGLFERTMPTVKTLMSVLKGAITAVRIRCVLTPQVLSCASAKLDTSELMIIHVQNMMSVSQISTTVMKMPYASILLEDTTVFASQAIRGMEPHAKHSAKMAVEMEELVLPLMCVPARKASPGPAVKRTLTSALMALFSVTVGLTALTCLDGTTVSAEMATMTMGCFHQVENLVKISMSVGPGGIAVPMIPFALTWMVDTIADVLMERIAQGTASMMGKLNTVVRFGCWKMTGALCVRVRMDLSCVAGWSVTARIPRLISFAALNVTQGLAVSASIKTGRLCTIVVTRGFRIANSAAACRGKLTVGLCLAQRWNVNSVSSQRTSAASVVSLTLARPTPFVMTSPKLAWMR